MKKIEDQERKQVKALQVLKLVEQQQKPKPNEDITPQELKI